MELSLLPFFDDFPLLRVQNGHPHRRRTRPMMRHLLDTLEDNLDRKVGYVYRRLPGILQELSDEFENRSSSSSKKRKRPTEDALTSYEPKSKVQVSRKDDKFHISLDTSHYQPQEITVKVVNDKLAISAKHESNNDDVYEFHEMYRSFTLPDDVDPDALTSRLSATGQLTVEAPVKSVSETPKERNIPVIRNEPSTPEKSSSPSKKTVDAKN